VMTNELFVRCDCGSIEHQFVLTRDTKEDEPEPRLRFVYMTIHLQDWDVFWKRLWSALRYTFGHRSRYGHWDSVILGPEQAANMYAVLDAYLQEVG